MGGARGEKTMKCAGDAAPQGRFPEAGGGCGEIHALRRRWRAWPSTPLCQAYLFGSGFSRAVPSAVSVRIEDQDGTVFAADLDRLAGVGALVERVETRIIHGSALPGPHHETTALPALYEHGEARHLCRTPSLNSVRSP